jgi:tetratricopeptide (TPR) repeat protein
VVVALFASACATLDDGDPAPVDVEDRVVLGDEKDVGLSVPLESEPEISTQPLDSQPIVSPVAQKLLLKAQAQRAGGAMDAAVNSLERALRIEPRNALLWNRLAEMKYEQQNWQQSVQFATKSNTLAMNDVNLRRQNWNLIANAYDAMAQFDAAEKYRQKLAQ